MSDYATSEEARKGGNRFFVEREFVKALDAYQKAADLDPNDWRPPWNMSAVHFELGNYNKVVATTSKILDGTHGMQENERQKVLQRLLKALLIRKRYSEAIKRLVALEDGTEKLAFEQVMRQLSSDKSKVTESGSSSNYARELPYTKPHMDDIAEFYTVGHDTPGSMYDALISHFAAEGETLAFFYAGIGDARHALQTIITIHRVEEMLEKEDMGTKNTKFHFTLNDVKHEALAKDLIFFLLLERLC